MPESEIRPDTASPGAQTRERLLEAAERLFAEEGIRATSLRKITASAGANLAAVNYHFGSKNVLAIEVFRRRIGPLNEQRLDRLTKLEAKGSEAPPSLEDVLEAFLAPAMELDGCGPGTYVRQLMVRIHAEGNSELLHLVFAEFRHVFGRFSEAIRRSCPHLPPAEVALRMRFMVGSMVFSLAQVPFMDSSGNPFHAEGDSALDLTDNLVRFLAAGFREPSALGGEDSA